MSKNASITLGEDQATFIAKLVARGEYSDASDVVRAGLCLLEEDDAHLDKVRLALISGEQGGTSPRNVKGIWAVVQGSPDYAG